MLNYYAMQEDELEYRLEKIRNWIWNANPSDPRYKTAHIALHIAYESWLMRKEGVDDFTQLVIDCIC